MNQPLNDLTVLNFIYNFWFMLHRCSKQMRKCNYNYSLRSILEETTEN